MQPVTRPLARVLMQSLTRGLLQTPYADPHADPPTWTLAQKVHFITSAFAADRGRPRSLRSFYSRPRIPLRIAVVKG
eukprot:15432150-Alexandrium_andersonii.AAC.1